MKFPIKVRRVMFVGKGRVAVEDETLAAPGPNQVVVKAIASVISPGTELAYLHQLENARWPLPGSPNEGFCGTVIARGQGVAEPAEGQRIVTALGHCSVGVATADGCYSVSDGVPSDQAAMFKLAATSLHGVRAGRVRLGQSVAIVGLGVIGNVAGQLARAAGATLVVGIDPVAWRRDLALTTGFDAVVDSSSRFRVDEFHQIKKAQGFDVVIEATGSPTPIVDAFRLARRLGSVVLLGSTRGITEKVDFYSDVHRKGITVTGAHYNARPAADDIDTLFTAETDIRTVLALMAAKRITVAPLISDTMPGEEAPKAYERLGARNESLVTIALNWQ